jgi:hypothetical protein
MSTINTLLHSPSSKVNVNARRRSQSPPSLSHRAPLSSFSSTTGAFGLAPSFAPSPFSSAPVSPQRAASTAASVAFRMPNDPHLQ